ncbi:MAG: hypothetical protein K0R76_312 [Alphaproteobacteria bacterium]|jgi:hypothetical protein|nr:hypothetical protein [Alphaproteobacteria bacterium]MDF3033358.1 hypothetical protein [Alphaproteobacteria bacterium]
MMDSLKDHILKNLTIIYWRALRRHNWKVALKAVEQQIKYVTLLEKQSLSFQHLPKAMRLEEMTEPQLKDFVAGLEKLYPEVKDLDLGLEDLDPALKHPPPASA